VPINACLGICLLINYKGHYWRASAFFIASLWVMCTCLALTAGGVSAPATLAYFPIIVAAGVFLGGRWGFIMSMLTIFIVLVMVWLQMYDLLPASQVSHTMTSRFVMYSLTVLLVAVMQYLSAWQWKSTLNQLKEELNERKKAEAAVQEINESLEKKIIERTEELQDANRALESFNYSVSHDLQAPLRTANGFARIVLRDYQDKLDENGKQLLQSIHSSMIRMGQLIKDMLEFSKSGRVVLAKENVDMNLIVASIIDEVKLGHDNFPAEIIIHDLTTTVCDPNLIKQVWANLILNSLKFSGKKEKPVIEIGNQFIDDHLTYYVRDNGVGFDMQYATKLFSPFQRLDYNGEFEGSGIGLATTHRIIARHEGRIWAEAKLNEGAVFYFTIPDT